MKGPMSIHLLFFIIVLEDSIKAEPRIDIAEKTSDLNRAISKDKKLLKLLQIRGQGRKQNEKAQLSEPVADPLSGIESEQQQLSEPMADALSGVNSEEQQLSEPAADPLSGAKSEEEHVVSKPVADPLLGVRNESNDYEVLSYTTTDNEADKKFKNTKSRALQVGDSITPEEMLILAQAYMKKVKNPGSGKGIVSGSKNPFELADILFERYFSTLQRIVKIREIDVDGLDALQALSLNGEAIDTLRSKEDSYTEAPIEKYKGFKAPAEIELYDLDPTDLPNKCHYKILKKNVKEDASPLKNNKTNDTNRRQADKLKKTLGPIRKLVVNPANKKRNKRLRAGRRILGLTKTKVIQHIRQNKQKDENLALTTSTTVKPSILGLQEEKKNLTCRWKYNCTIPWRLRSCRLFPHCTNETNYYSFFLDPDENLRKFREAVGITGMDEEVEKILELHSIRMNPGRGDRDKNVETLMKYFNDMVSASGDTTPMPSAKNTDEEVLSVHPSSSSTSDEHATSGEQHRDAKQARRQSGDNNNKDKDDEEARRLLGVVLK